MDQKCLRTAHPKTLQNAMPGRYVPLKWAPRPIKWRSLTLPLLNSALALIACGLDGPAPFYAASKVAHRSG